MKRGADGAPEATGVWPAIVALPATGSAPCHSCCFSMAVGRTRPTFQLARPLAEAGFAFVAIDLPYHGDRAKASGGSDLDFVDFSDLAKTRDNFRQAVADHQAVFTGMAALNGALEPVLGVKNALDAARLLHGLSSRRHLGSMTSRRPERRGSLPPALSGSSRSSRPVANIESPTPSERRSAWRRSSDLPTRWFTRSVEGRASRLPCL
jgi:hypothetical protein